MKFLTLALFLVTGAVALAATQSEIQNTEAQLNRGVPNGAASKLGTKLVYQTDRLMRATYDFSVLGGAAGTVNLKDANTGETAKLPKGAIIKNCLIDVVTAPSPSPVPSASPSPTIALTAQTAADLKAATAGTALTALVACIPVGTAATSIKLTADRTLTATIAGGDLAAGKFYVIINYWQSNTL